MGQPHKCPPLCPTGWLPPELGELWGRGARPGPVELPSEVEVRLWGWGWLWGGYGVVVGPGGPCPTAPAPQVPREALEPSLAVLPSSGESPLWGGVGRCGAVWGVCGALWGWLWVPMGPVAPPPRGVPGDHGGGAPAPAPPPGPARGAAVSDGGGGAWPDLAPPPLSVAPPPAA